MGFLSDIAGSFVEGIFGMSSAKQAQQFSAKMANTQHQREVKDLRAAGLNPILSATGGPGAAAPQGVKADTPKVTQNMNSARVAREQAENLRAQRDNIDKDTELKEWQRRLEEQRVVAQSMQNDLTAPLVEYAASSAAIDFQTKGQGLRSATEGANSAATKARMDEQEYRALSRDPDILRWRANATKAEIELYDRALKGNVTPGERAYLYTQLAKAGVDVASKLMGSIGIAKGAKALSRRKK